LLGVKNGVIIKPYRRLTMTRPTTFTAKAINAAVKKHKPRAKPYAVAAKGRCIRINFDGVNLVYRDRKNGDTTTTLGAWGGVYGITCKQAEKKIEELQGELKEKKTQELLQHNTFQAVAERWLKHRRKEWSVDYYDDKDKQLTNHVYPVIGDLDVRELTKYHVLQVAESLNEAEKLETRNRVHGLIRRVLEEAVFDDCHPKHPTGLQHNVAAFNLTSAPRMTKREGEFAPKHYKAMRLDRIPEFLSDLRLSLSDPTVKLLIVFQLLTMTRPSEAREALWEQINWKERLWKIPGGTRKELGVGNHMKKNREHWIPLSDQAVRVLKELWEITGEYGVLFPKIKSSSYYGGNGKIKGQKLDPDRFDSTDHLSYNAAGFAIHDLGGTPGNWKYDEHPHGFRKTASTYLHGLKDKSGKQEFASEWIEYQLAHTDENKVRDTYIDKTPDLYLDSRRDMIQVWGDVVMPRKLSVVKVA